MKSILKDVLTDALNSRSIKEERIYTFDKVIDEDLSLYAGISCFSRPSNVAAAVKVTFYQKNENPDLEDKVICDCVVRHYEDVEKLADEMGRDFTGYIKYLLSTNIATEDNPNKTKQIEKAIKLMFDMGYGQFNIPVFPDYGENFCLIFTISDFKDMQIVNVDSDKLPSISGDSFADIAVKIYEQSRKWGKEKESYSLTPRFPSFSSSKYEELEEEAEIAL